MPESSVTGEVRVSWKMVKSGYYVIITSQKQPHEQLKICRTLLAMLVFLEDLKETC